MCYRVVPRNEASTNRGDVEAAREAVEKLESVIKELTSVKNHEQACKVARIQMGGPLADFVREFFKGTNTPGWASGTVSFWQFLTELKFLVNTQPQKVRALSEEFIRLAEGGVQE